MPATLIAGPWPQPGDPPAPPVRPRDPEKVRKEIKRRRARLGRLENERSSYEAHWRDIADHVKPRRHKLDRKTKRKLGTKKNEKILNNTGTRALRILGSGMMAGITSPSRPWFRLVAPRPELMMVRRVRVWLASVEERMREVFARSNIYNSFSQIYEDIALYGPGCMYIEEDSKDVIRTSVHDIGSFYLALDHYGRVNAVYLRLVMTVEQLHDKFGYENLSRAVRDLWDQDQWDEPICVVQCVEVNRDRDPSKEDASGMRWRSLWFEEDVSSDDDERYLGERGYREFPFACPRWMVSSGEVYGGSPGMDALPDIRMLQKMEQRRGQVLDKIVNPTMKAPTNLRKERHTLLPGDITYVDEQQGRGKYEPAHVVDSKAVYLENELLRVENRINSTFMSDLFLMIANMAISGVTAREIEERHEEKMLQLGPTLERLQDELLKPVIDRTFEIMIRNGMIAPAPPELQGQDLQVEYVSIFAQAQKLPAANAIERATMYIQGLASITPEAIEVLDAEVAARRYTEVVGAPPEMIRSVEDLMARRRAAQQQQQLMQGQIAAKAARDVAGAARDLEQAPTATQALGPALGLTA